MVDRGSAVALLDRHHVLLAVVILRELVAVAGLIGVDVGLV